MIFLHFMIFSQGILEKESGSFLLKRMTEQENMDFDIR